jgi:hypothetical protein
MYLRFIIDDPDKSLDDITLVEICSNPDHPFRSHIVLDKKRSKVGAYDPLLEFKPLLRKLSIRRTASVSTHMKISSDNARDIMSIKDVRDVILTLQIEMH